MIAAVGLGAAWAAVVLGWVAAAAALYGRYRVLPAWLTGPTVCRLEAGGCQVLFRTPQAKLVLLPNAVWGLILYSAVAAGLLLHVSVVPLFVGASLALAMSVHLAVYLLRNRL